MKLRLAALFAALLAASAVLAQSHDPAMHRHDPAPAAAAPRPMPATDTRQAVHFPPALREDTLANMRDHLLALQQIQDALARQEYDLAGDLAGDLAEQRLGMSSLARHGAHEVAQYMPQGMREIGGAMHRSASRFAVAAQDAGATGDVKPALAALAQVTAQCVACHAGYRVK